MYHLHNFAWLINSTGTEQVSKAERKLCKLKHIPSTSILSLWLVHGVRNTLISDRGKG